MFRRHTLDMCFVERKSVSAEVRYGVQPNLPDWLLLAVGVSARSRLAEIDGPSVRRPEFGSSFR